jgi:CRP-like cAMP-binding protein
MAKAVLEKSEFLHNCSAPFQDDIAQLMVPCDCQEGHIFINEGDRITSFLIVESGTLYRTKRRTEEGSEVEVPFQIDVMGPGRVTGFLHVAGASSDEEVAFATIVAGKGGARVWEVSGGDFRKMCESNPMVSKS